MESSDTSSFGSKCRICWETINYNDFPNVFRSCRCNDYVHKLCLEKQLSIKYQDICEVCNCSYVFNMYHKNKKTDVFEMVIPIQSNVDVISTASDPNSFCGLFTKTTIMASSVFIVSLMMFAIGLTLFVLSGRE